MVARLLSSNGIGSSFSVPRMPRMSPVLTVTSSKERQIKAYSIGLTIPGKLSCTNKNNNKKVSDKSVVRVVPFCP